MFGAYYTYMWEFTTTRSEVTRIRSKIAKMNLSRRHFLNHELLNHTIKALTQLEKYFGQTKIVWSVTAYTRMYVFNGVYFYRHSWNGSQPKGWPYSTDRLCLNLYTSFWYNCTKTKIKLINAPWNNLVPLGILWYQAEIYSIRIWFVSVSISLTHR